MTTQLKKLAMSYSKLIRDIAMIQYHQKIFNIFLITTLYGRSLWKLAMSYFKLMGDVMIKQKYEEKNIEKYVKIIFS